MPLSESRKKANEKYNAANYEQMQIRLRKDGKDPQTGNSQPTKEQIASHAEKQGETVNAFVIRAIAETMRRDQESAGAE